MSLKLKLGGSYSLTNQVAIAISRSDRRDSTGKRLGYTEKWTVTGWLAAATPTLLTTAIDALKAACVDGIDVGLYEAGSPDVATSHILTSSATLGGTRITGPSFPIGQGPEYANQRAFTIEVEADYQDAGAATLLAFQETISMVGTGGPRFVTQVPLEGPVVFQQVSQATPVLITQSGSAMGLLTWPAAPGPISGGGEHMDRRRLERRGPQRMADGTYRNFEVSWSMEFETSAASSPNPHSWGA